MNEETSYKLFNLVEQQPNISQRELAKEMGISLGKLLHGEQNFTYHAPICAGDTITLQSKVVDIYDKKGGALEFLVQDYTLKNQDDQLVAEVRSTLVVRN